MLINTYRMDSCIFCRDTYQPDDQITYLTKCQHLFHKSCLTPWTEKEAGEAQNSKCPICNDISPTYICLESRLFPIKLHDFTAPLLLLSCSGISFYLLTSCIDIIYSSVMGNQGGSGGFQIDTIVKCYTILNGSLILGAALLIALVKSSTAISFSQNVQYKQLSKGKDCNESLE